MRVRVDPEKCQGHNRCFLLAPELFDIDDCGYASASGDGVVPPELEDKAKLAAANCPEYAVIVEAEGPELIATPESSPPVDDWAADTTG